MKGGYRSAASYVSVWRCWHIESGGQLNDTMRLLCKRVTTAVSRGIGGAKKAVTYDIDDLEFAPMLRAQLHTDGPLWPTEALTVGTWWLLREIELSSLTGGQVVLITSEKIVELNLGPTKADVRGVGARRRLACTCDPSKSERHNCPFHAVARVMTERARRGLSDADPLFPTAAGATASKAGVIHSMRKLLRKPGLTGHSARRAGAQSLARRALAPWKIKFLGRWGSAEVERYIAEAYADVTASFSVEAMAGAVPHGQASHLPSAAPLLLHEEGQGAMSPDVMRRLVDEASAQAREKFEEEVREERRSCEIEVAKLRTKASQCREVWEATAARLHDRVQRGPPLVKRTAAGTQETVHEVKIGSAEVPILLWTTVCGWSFGLAPHERFEDGAATCDKCLRRRRRESSQAAGGSVSSSCVSFGRVYREVGRGMRGTVSH